MSELFGLRPLLFGVSAYLSCLVFDEHSLWPRYCTPENPVWSRLSVPEERNIRLQEYMVPKERILHATPIFTMR